MASILRVKDQNGNEIDIPAIKGASAYEIAVKNGFKGTEEEWLESLKGGGSSEPKPVLPPIEAVVDFAEAHIHTQNTNCITIETSLLPNNARAKKIEIPDIVSGTDEYIQLEDMVAKDPMGLGSSYFVMYPKNAQGVFYTVAACVVFPTFPNSFYDAVDTGVFDNKTIKIYYDIEE
jgi:hypothetical protein